MMIALCKLALNKRIGSFFLAVIAILLFARASHALMQPQVYAERALSSDIKAIAVILEVNILNTGTRSTEKMVTFKTEYALTEKTSDRFSGSCHSVDTPEQEANTMVGGQIYFYPVQEQRVFVTVRSNGGVITSFTPITEELETAIREKPNRLRYGIGKVEVID
ncbi:hypothetical protein [Cohaesibacter celericrescens]|uniref:Uncharacterized protein n=1 Tax=Cohaesibacter celericrescens TaxID=2067669 RepID=A0A2N5XQ50_9HYPH|nr:hypothetical protein [Cohaesibacter celericrescens]PLW76642.1 hypothetical protein C0081_13700 [Cohaesibacter celericrescens]